jgi:hypothetical protein
MDDAPLPKPRPVDHVVVAVHDLEAARAAYARLGFTVTPVASHPFGTANALVQLGPAYVELVAVVDSAKIPSPADGVYSFGAFVRDFLERRGEGPAMLALNSRDAAADRADFEAHDLPTYAPLSFARLARNPRGEDLEVAFSVTFTSDARMPDAGFFTCQHHNPDGFWWPEYRRHANGAHAIDAVAMVGRDPADYHIFFTFFTRQHDMRSDSLMVSFDTGGGKVEIVTPVMARAMYGVEVESNPKPHFIGIRVATADLAAAAVTLKGNSVPFVERMGRLVVPSSEACGVAIAFAEA